MKIEVTNTFITLKLSKIFITLYQYFLIIKFHGICEKIYSLFENPF